MMKRKPKLCNKDCIPACDFCRMLNDFKTHKGYCVFHEKEVHLGDKCNDFICSNYAGKKFKKKDFKEVFEKIKDS